MCKVWLILTGILFQLSCIQVKANAQFQTKNHDIPAEIKLESAGILPVGVNESFDQVRLLPDSAFKTVQKQQLNKDSTYWFKIVLTNLSENNVNYYLHFNNTLSDVELYQINPDSSVAFQKAGVLVKPKDRTINRYIGDRVKLRLASQQPTCIYLRLQNELAYKNIDTYFTIIQSPVFEYNSPAHNLSLGIFLGTILLLIIFSGILFFFAHDYLYLLYALYMIFIVAYFSGIFQLTDRFIFTNSPLINLYLAWALYISQNIYFLFLNRILNKEPAGFKKNSILSILYVTVPILVILFILSRFNYSTALTFCYFYSIMSITIAIVLFFIYYRKVQRAAKLILTGVLFMVLGAFFNMIVIDPKLPGFFAQEMHLYQAGILIELILFMVAVTWSFYDEIKKKHLIEEERLKLKVEKLRQEKENILLKQEVDSKIRELATTSIKLTEKESVILNLMKKLTELKPEQENELEIQHLITDLKQHLKNNSWSEFETYFNKVHPEFYNKLVAQYPNLSSNERKLCAYLKLNLSTKDILLITGKSENTINVARSRLRKKMDMRPDENLQVIIASIS